MFSSTLNNGALINPLLPILILTSELSITCLFILTVVSESDSTAPKFSYTISLSNSASPEVIVLLVYLL